jgi:uncharacterized protein
MGAARFFEWDEDKATLNARKHGVLFPVATRVFADQLGFELLIDHPRRDEERWNFLGLVDGRLLVVTYTMRGKVTRIISARFATARERRGYHG